MVPPDLPSNSVNKKWHQVYHISTYHTATDSKLWHTLNYSVGEQYHKAHPYSRHRELSAGMMHFHSAEPFSQCPPSPARLLPGAVLSILKKAEAAPTPKKRITSIQVSSNYTNHYFLHVWNTYCAFSHMWGVWRSTGNWDMSWKCPRRTWNVWPSHLFSG